MSEGLNYLFNPRSIAVIGATAREGSVGGVITRNLLTKFRGGRVYLVNPSYTELLGHRVYRSVLEIPDEVDLAVIVTPAPTVPRIMSECVAKGVRAAIVISGGFSEAGEDGGAKLEKEVKNAAQGRVKIPLITDVS
ncbi:CoA-binding protein [Vulcanisaeta distributa]|uniref:CoA-binding protein n=1 Tax=Vulcanisaeta distributa TaxID=164451 RepID=UPI0006CFDF9D|nr:CoA-binding protein [Vulcanisaeta distributa]